MVTGGAGFIGSHACKKLKAEGYTPITVDNLSTGWSGAVRFGPFENLDLRNFDDIYDCIHRYRPIAVMHFAAMSQVGESQRLPFEYWNNNLVGSFNLINAAVKLGCNNFIFSSTCATYGDHDGLVLTEDTPQAPASVYGSTKRSVEEILISYANASLLNFKIFRYFNVAGSDPECEIGELHRPETHLIPLILEVVKGERDALTIFGSDYSTPDGTCIRDYIHVIDLVDAHILGLKALLDSKPSAIYNLGTGSGFSVKEVIQKVEEVTGKKVPLIYGQRRDGDCAKLVSGSAKATSELGWSSLNSKLEKMISDAWAWHNSDNFTTCWNAGK